MTLPPMHRGDAGLVGFIDASYAGSLLHKGYVQFF